MDYINDHSNRLVLTVSVSLFVKIAVFPTLWVCMVYSFVSDLICFSPCRMYTEVQAEDVAISLFIKRLSDEDAGLYRCAAVYAGNMELEASVSVSIFCKL